MYHHIYKMIHFVLNLKYIYSKQLFQSLHQHHLFLLYIDILYFQLLLEHNYFLLLAQS